MTKTTMRVVLASGIGISIIAVASILAILTPHARTDGDACNPPAEMFARFEADKVGAAAPDVAIFDGTDNARTLADWRGKGVVLNLWATWCAPCVREMPALDRLAAAVAPEGIAVLTLSEDREGRPVIESFYEKNGIRNLPVLVDRRQAMLRALGAPGLPTTVLFDADGREVGRVVGATEWDRIDVNAFLGRCLGGGDAKANRSDANRARAG